MPGAVDAWERVPAAEISRNFGEWQDRAMSTPVVVTHHGRPRVVIQSFDAIRQMRSELSVAARGEARHERALMAVLNHMVEGFIALDRDLRIVMVNQGFEDMTGSCASQLAGKVLRDEFPAHVVFYDFVYRTLKLGEACEFDIASMLEPGRTYRARAFPYNGGVGVTLLSRAEDQVRMRKDAAAAARLQSVLALPGVCTATVNLRGLLMEVSEALADLTGFEAADLASVQLAQLMKPATKYRVTEALEAAIEAKEKTAATVVLLTKGLTETPVNIAFAPVVQDGVVTAVSMALARAWPDPSQP